MSELLKVEIDSECFVGGDVVAFSLGLMCWHGVLTKQVVF